MQKNTDYIKIFRRDAKIENYNELCSWVKETRAKWNISKELANKLDICIEEVFANILHYAYPGNIGIFEVKLQKTNENIIIEFKDEGIEFNPLEKQDPEINLPPEKRTPGGLGIFLTKKMTDNIIYKREDNKNILTLIFKV